MKNISRSSLVILAMLLIGTTQSFAKESDRVANQPAQLLSAAAPSYPYLLQRAEAAAEVTVSFIVDPHGMVTKAKILSSSNCEFNDSALAAVRKWTFAPALKDGRAIEAKLQQKFVFSVRDQGEMNARTVLTAGKGSR